MLDGREATMAQITIDRESEDERSYAFRVTVAEQGTATTHEVTLGRDELERLAEPAESPESFLRRCFSFLLARERKESILPSFDVRVIGRYFPEFPSEMRAPD
jgi:hypothetical protein